VIETGAGNCHLFIDESAKVDMATDISINAKTQRPSVCNAIETLLVHEDWFTAHGVELLEKIAKYDVTIYGDETVCNAFAQAKAAQESDWYKEYLGLELSVKVVSSHKEAINHINTYGTKHSEAIVTENESHAN